MVTYKAGGTAVRRLADIWLLEINVRKETAGVDINNSSCMIQWKLPHPSLQTYGSILVSITRALSTDG